MFSRLAARPAQYALLARPILPTQVRVSQYAAKANEPEQEALNVKEGPERDLVNFPRLTRPLYPNKVRLGFVPEEWFQFFYKKTGVTGPYVFGAGVLTYLLSKEIWVMEHEFYNGFAIAVFGAILIKTVGPQMRDFLDKEMHDYEKGWKDYRKNSMKSLTTAIESEEKEQWRAQGQNILFDAKRENIQLQLEAKFRARQLSVYQEVRRRLDYQLDYQNTTRRLEQKHMVKWIVDSVVKGITPQQEKEAVQQCILTLKSLAAKA